MRVSFEKIVEEIQKLPLVEKEEIKLLVEKYIIEERREEIYQIYSELMGFLEKWTPLPFSIYCILSLWSNYVISLNSERVK